MPARQQITFQHSFQRVLAQHLNDAAVGASSPPSASSGKYSSIQNFLLTS